MSQYNIISQVSDFQDELHIFEVRYLKVIIIQPLRQKISMHQQEQASRQEIHNNVQQNTHKQSKDKPTTEQNVSQDMIKINDIQSKIVHSSSNNSKQNSSASLKLSNSSHNAHKSSIFFIYFFNKLYLLVFRQHSQNSSQCLKHMIFLIIVLPFLIPLSILYTMFIIVYLIVIWLLFIPLSVALAQTAKHYILLKIHPSCWYTLLLMIALQFIPLCIFVLYVYRLCIVLCSQAFKYDMKVLLSGKLTPILRCKPFVGDNYTNMQQYIKEQQKYQCNCVCCCQNCHKCQLATTKYPNHKAPINQLRIWCMFYQKQSIQFPLLKKLRVETKEELKKFVQKMEIQDKLKDKVKDQQKGKYNIQVQKNKDKVKQEDKKKQQK